MLTKPLVYAIISGYTFFFSLSAFAFPLDKKPFCSHYAILAVTQHNIQRNLRCGFTGTRRSSEGGKHHAWCLRASKKELMAEIHARQNSLVECSDRFPQVKQAPHRKKVK